ncbi:MAG: NUDIX hydrolase [Candidatus Doudnabacteria bacterium]|nr:NUDIX hydrolase [Candidatus Doudnabacteria bacterium]
MPKIWKKLSSKVIHKDPWSTIHLDTVIKPDGKPGNYAWLQVPSQGVMVLAITEKQEIYLVKLFRYPTKMYFWELPGGGSGNQNSLKAAKRELWEETGLVAKTWKKLGESQNFNSFSDAKTDIYIATNLTQTGLDKKHEDGIVEVKKIPLKKVLQMVESKKITEVKVIAALTLYFLKNKKIKI